MDILGGRKAVHPNGKLLCACAPKVQPLASLLFISNASYNQLLVGRQVDDRFRILNGHYFGKFNTLIFHCSPPFGNGYNGLSDDKVVEQTMITLRGMYGTEAVPAAPLFSHVTRWDSDPFSMGAYSYWKTGMQLEDVLNSARPEPEMASCGGETTPSAAHPRSEGSDGRNRDSSAEEGQDSPSMLHARALLLRRARNDSGRSASTVHATQGSERHGSYLLLHWVICPISINVFVAEKPSGTARRRSSQLLKKHLRKEWRHSFRPGALREKLCAPSISKASRLFQARHLPAAKKIP